MAHHALVEQGAEEIVAEPAGVPSRAARSPAWISGRAASKTARHSPMREHDRTRDRTANCHSP